MKTFLALVKIIKSAILDYWEMTLPKTVFVPVEFTVKSNVAGLVNTSAHICS